MIGNRAVLCIAALVCMVCAQKNTGFGEYMGRPIHWATDRFIPDTIGWREIETEFFPDDSSRRVSPAAAIGPLSDSGKTVYRLKDVLSIGAALMHDGGCKIIVLSQWSAVLPTSTYFSISGSSSRGEESNKYRGVSDYIWEQIERVEVVKPGRLGETYKVTLHFKGGGYSSWSANEDIRVHPSRMVTPSDALRVLFTNSTDIIMDVSRRVFAVYAIVSSDQTPKKITAQVEGSMDKMKLDLTYKAPLLTLLKP